MREQNVYTFQKVFAFCMAPSSMLLAIYEITAAVEREVMQRSITSINDINSKFSPAKRFKAIDIDMPPSQIMSQVADNFPL